MTNTSSISPMLRWLITITVMLAAMIEIIDTTIINVALNDMAGALGANTSQISWVSTSYVVSAAIFMPLTGFLVKRIGRKRLLLMNITGFMICSALCGMATSLSELVFFRILQGVFGASLVPLSQYILRDTFPPEEHVKAMAIWGVGIMAAPVLGPTLGGYITQHLSWRWIFYINVPVCLIATAMAFLFISETIREKIRIDWQGLALMVIAIGCLQIFLDRGHESDWLQSNVIIGLMLTWILALIIFISRGWNKPGHIVKLTLFKDRNYAIGNLLIVLVTANLFGVLTVQPLVMEQFFGYTPQSTGLMMAPRGIASALAMMIVQPLAKRLDLRIVLAIGIAILALGSYQYAHLTPQAGPWNWIAPAIVQGIGMGLFFVPISTIAFQTLNRDDTAEGSGLFGFTRNIGTSIGISVMVTFLASQAQRAWHGLVGHIRPTNPSFQHWLTQTNLSSDSPQTYPIIAQQIMKQAHVISFCDISYFAFIVTLLSLPLIGLLSNPNAAR